MINFLDSVLTQQVPKQQQGSFDNVDWQWLGEGIIAFTPHQAYTKVIALSTGIHGNETAPIELLDQICNAIQAQSLSLKVRLLLVLGNPMAIRQGLRYIENDMNRMFCSAYNELDVSHETYRAKQLEQVFTAFFSNLDCEVSRYHYDLHTAIRSSLLPTFALLPYQTQHYDPILLNSLHAAELDAVVYHNTSGKTLTHFTSSVLHVASVTLELGDAKPFGQNDLSQFKDIYQVIRSVLTETELPKRKKTKIRSFKVIDSILKIDEDFKLNVASNAPNFTTFHAGVTIATQTSGQYIFSKETKILFPNPNVKKGLRAGLVLEEMT